MQSSTVAERCHHPLGHGVFSCGLTVCSVVALWCGHSHWFGLNVSAFCAPRVVQPVAYVAGQQQIDHDLACELASPWFSSLVGHSGPPRVLVMSVSLNCPSFAMMLAAPEQCICFWPLRGHVATLSMCMCEWTNMACVRCNEAQYGTCAC